MTNLCQLIATELGIKNEQVQAVITLLDSGATVPFISRYRKEITGGLDDTQLRHLEERLYYLRELEERRQIILKHIQEQDKLTPALEKQIQQVTTKASLEDLYLPYKPKRRTKAQIAIEAGLLVLAQRLLENPLADPKQTAKHFIDPQKNIHTSDEALEGARYILMDQFAEDANLLSTLRDFFWEHAILTATVVKGQEESGNKFQDYFNYQEAIKKIPSHRALALLRGQREEILTIHLSLTKEEETLCQQKILSHFQIQDKKRPGDAWLLATVALTWKVKLFLKFEIESCTRLRENSEIEAIRVFGNNLKNLLMAAPAGSKITMGLDPGMRTGVKVVVVDETGKLLKHAVIFPHAPRNEWHESLQTLADLCKTYQVQLISIGNGTASRETDKLISELKRNYPHLALTSIVVSEAGASVYSASELAAEEFPELDVVYRGAVSIARRLQDPLAELVKIEPKAIGVGQYQHDVNQFKLSRALSAVMEDCVNAVGVDVNTASVPLLSCIAGLNATVAKNIVAFRDQHGAFKDRLQLKKVPRLGDKAYEQAAGFLRIMQGHNPLDASAVHPEAYEIVERILKKNGQRINNILGNKVFIKTLQARDYIDAHFGIPTVLDIFNELEKPGRDPRGEFKKAVFKEGVDDIKDLLPGMILEGVVTNVANFGAFVDIGVHQDGLVHISMLADHFVKNPHDVVKVSDIVKVKVVAVDLKRARIQLSMRLKDEASSNKNKEKIKVANHFSEHASLGNKLQDAFKKHKK